SAGAFSDPPTDRRPLRPTNRTDAPSTHQPTDAPSTHQPTDAPSTHQPTDAPSTHQPTDAPSTHQPADAFSTHQPADGADVGLRLLAAFSAEVGLAEPDLPWHTERTRIADLAGALGAAAGAVAKVARDLTLFAQTEVGEMAEGGDGGGSSTLPHKHNPIAAISAAAAAAQAPGLVATLLTAMAHEHQRAAGNWHAEWQPLRALLTSTGSAAHQLRRALAHLRVDTGRMRANLDLTHGALLAERVAGALRPALGAEAHAVVRAAVARGDLRTDPAITAHLSPSRLAGLLAPETYVGSANALIDRALRAARR
ncbi:lyase family protein, partial [Actinoplanes sp. ATCC 53533]|uniref:lyase family protein n=1 Tax=Actinoplanes sp. ATCC 53533 TaxID=1288362 RepID=UPI0021042590